MRLPRFTRNDTHSTHINGVSSSIETVLIYPAIMTVIKTRTVVKINGVNRIEDRVFYALHLFQGGDPFFDGGVCAEELVHISFNFLERIHDVKMCGGFVGCL